LSWTRRRVRDVQSETITGKYGSLIRQRKEGKSKSKSTNHAAQFAGVRERSQIQTLNCKNSNYADGPLSDPKNSTATLRADAAGSAQMLV
jgi:hypothetical protein